MLKHFVGYIEDRDEYQQGVINKVLAKACMYIFFLTTILMLISLIIDTMNHTFTFGTIALLIVQQFVSYYVFTKLKKAGITDSEYDIEADYKIKINQLKRGCLIAGAQWGFIMLVLMEFLLPTLAGEEVRLDLVSCGIWIVAGGVFGTVLYFMQRKNIKMVKEE